MENQPTIEDSLLIAYLNGEADQAQIEQVEIWLAANSQNQKDFETLKSAWQHAGAMADFASIDVEANWKQVQQKIYQPKSKQYVWRPVVWRYAAAVVLIATLGFLAIQYLAGPQMLEVTASVDELKVDLPDGSEVWLNKGARLTYPESFARNERNVTLQGEAFFEVAHNAESPFTVEADGTETKVLGTSFNLKELEGSKLELVLVTGKVSFTAGQQQVILLPGETVLVDEKGNLTKQPNDNRNFMAWKTRRLEFRSTPMSQAVKDLEELYNVKIEIRNPEFGSCPLTTTFENDSLEDVLRAFEILFDTKIEKLNNTYVINAKGC